MYMVAQFHPNLPLHAKTLQVNDLFDRFFVIKGKEKKHKLYVVLFFMKHKEQQTQGSTY